MKKVALKAKPQASTQSSTPDEWVSAASTPAMVSDEPNAAAQSMEKAIEMKRLTIDIPSDLHTRIKMQCAARGRKMADEIRDLLEGHFGTDA